MHGLICICSASFIRIEGHYHRRPIVIGRRSVVMPEWEPWR